jgi:hypothetical protein
VREGERKIGRRIRWKRSEEGERGRSEMEKEAV